MTPTADTLAAPSTSRKRRIRLAATLLLTTAGLIGGYYGFWRYHLKRFTVVAPGIFYRVAQPTEFGLWHAARHHGVRTVVSLQLFDFRLYRGLIDPGKPDGDKESVYANKIGMQHIQWPMGDEQCWPWPDPWELEEFFRLVDDPSNRPIMIHCMGGRHRTGTFSALYRLEYDRWSPDAALNEMYTYSFGAPIPAQERHLRTYVPRPMPTPEEWPMVAAAFGVSPEDSPALVVPTLAFRIRNEADDGPLRKALAKSIQDEQPYSLALAARVVNRIDDPLLPTTVPRARAVLESRSANERETIAATTLIADFGSPADQKYLLELLREQSQTPVPTPFYEALVCGVTNRYTPNRLAFLRPLLDDHRRRIGQNNSRYAYADTAMIRVAAITDEVQILGYIDEVLVADGPKNAIAWFKQHAEAEQLRRLLPPLGPQVAQEGEGPLQEDLSKMRR